MAAAEYIWAGVALWLFVAVLLSLLVGRVIRGRDAQVPTQHSPRDPDRGAPAIDGHRAHAPEQPDCP